MITYGITMLKARRPTLRLPPGLSESADRCPLKDPRADEITLVDLLPGQEERSFR